MQRNRIVRAAACAALACAGLTAGVARAQQQAPVAPAPVSQSQAAGQGTPLYLGDQDRKPAMTAMDKLGVGSIMDQFGVRFGGHVELGWTYNFDEPETGINVGRVFDFEDQDPTFHQLDLFIERTPASDRFDVGGRIEWIYGADARLLHANGIFDHYGLGDGPNNQWDPLQFYLDVNVPVGDSSVLLRGGRFVTLLGMEYVDPTRNPLYSRSFLFGFAIPFTHLGVTGKYQINDQNSVTLGVVRGWEQGFEDNNSAVSFLGQYAYDSEGLDVYVTAITGPEQAGNDSDYRTVLDLIVSAPLGEGLSVAVNADVGFEPNVALDGGDAWWYGVAAYATIKYSDALSLQARVEWFNDTDGARGLDTNVYEATLGLNITPFHADPLLSGLVLRPEVRFDYASDDIFDDGDENTQFTFGADLIFAF